MESRNQAFRLYKSVIMIVLIAVSTVQLSSIVLPNGTVVYAYTNNQAQSLSNECDVIDSSGVSNCQNSGPQTQADGTASSPITFQISNFGQQGTQEPTEPLPDTCEECFTAVLTDEEETEFLGKYDQRFTNGAGIFDIIEDVCSAILSSPDSQIQTIEELLGPGSDGVTGMNLEQDRIDEIINCLKNIFGVE